MEIQTQRQQQFTLQQFTKCVYDLPKQHTKAIPKTRRLLGYH